MSVEPAKARIRTLRWPAGASATPLDRVLRQLLGDASWAHCRRLVETGKVCLNTYQALDPRILVQPDTEVSIHPNAARPRQLQNVQVRLVYADSQIVVADKPSGISTVPFDSSERGALDELVRRALEQKSHRRLPPLGIVHRIDKETSGLVAFARTLGAKRHLKQQFRFHTNERVYLALAHGDVRAQRLESRLVADRGDGKRGSTRNPQLGQLAITHVEPVERCAFATLVRCRLETGRTHQIRIQLAEAGHPLMGEKVYVRPGIDSAGTAPRTMLHAAELAIVHPTREQRVEFNSPLPDDFSALLRRIRVP